MRPVAGQHEGAGQIDGKRPGTGERERQGVGRHGNGEFVPCRPEGGEARHQENARKRHADPRPLHRAPAERREDQEIDGGVFEEIDTVGEQRHRADGEGDGELHPEITEVEQRHEPHGTAQASGFGGCNVHVHHPL